MTLPARFSLAVSLGLSLLPTAYGGASEPPERPASHRPVEPSPLSIRLSNQEIAESIAARLRQSGVLQHYDVDIRFRDGVAELTGSVGDAGQRDRVLHLVQSVPGVERVVDHLSVPGAIVPVQAGGVPQALPPVPSTNPVPPGAPPAAGSWVPRRPASPAPEATPIFQAPAPAPHHLNPPRMPPYAWPTTPPYNNYSRVGYSPAYPYNSFPVHRSRLPLPESAAGLACWCGWNGTMASGGSARPRVAGTGGNCGTINRQSARHAGQVVEHFLSEPRMQRSGEAAAAYSAPLRCAARTLPVDPHWQGLLTLPQRGTEGLPDPRRPSVQAGGAAFPSDSVPSRSRGCRRGPRGPRWPRRDCASRSRCRPRICQRDRAARCG